MNLGEARVIQGNALHLPLPDASVDLICTSPPYFGLRSYQDEQFCLACINARNDGRDLRQVWPDYEAHKKAEHFKHHYEGQIGSEATPTEFLDALIAATREMVRVLKPSGSIFVNLGDKYSGAMGQTHGNAQSTVIPRSRFGGTPQKSLMGLPWRYAIRCIDQLNLILRAEIIWSKPNGLPESVTDRVRRSHEQWFHFTRSPRYFAAVDEIREPHLEPHRSTGKTESDGTLASIDGDRLITSRTSLTWKGERVRQYSPLGKLPGSVWTVPTQPLTVPPELGVDHFAAYPMEWPRRIIQGWTPTGICVECGEGRRPTVNKAYEKLKDGPTSRGYLKGDSSQWTHQGGRATTDESRLGRVELTTTIIGYVCACPTPTAPATPAVVLDSFGGTGTTALVAKALGRTGITVDLSADYCRLAEWRCNDPGQLATALQVEKPEPISPDQLELFGDLT